jgi:hypothetical protein
MNHMLKRYAYIFTSCVIYCYPYVLAWCMYEMAYFFMPARIIQNAKVQRTHVETLCIPVWIIPFQSRSQWNGNFSYNLWSMSNKPINKKVLKSVCNIPPVLYINKMKTSARCNKCFKMFQFPQFQSCCCDLIYWLFY